jgi:RsiW-degrading membrane proteinase PrsW (M82 family)
MTNAISPSTQIKAIGRKSLWRTGIAEIVILLIYVGVMQLLGVLIPANLEGTPAVVLSAILALIPAGLWLAFFYAQDRAEPEPLHFVAGVAMLGGLLAGAVGQPLINTIFRVPDWITRSTTLDILGSILVVGFIQEFLKYAAVRFSVYNSSEFNQRVDGVVYGMAAGVGYATAVNIGTVLQAGGFADVGAGVVRIVITALSHGVLGGLVGYFLGRNRLENKPIWWMPLGIALAAAINGLSSWARTEVSIARFSLATGGGGFSPWPALGTSAVIALVILLTMLWLMRRANLHELHAEERDLGNTNSLMAAIAVTAVAVVLGLAARDSFESRTQTHADASGLAISYPNWWALDKRDAANGTLRARDADATGFPTTLEVQVIPIDDKFKDEAAIATAAAQLNVNRSQSLGSLKVFDLEVFELNSEPPKIKSIKGLPAGTSSYVFVSSKGTLQQESLPAVVLGDDTFVRKGNKVYVFTLHSTEANRPMALPKYQAFIASAKLP